MISIQKLRDYLKLEAGRDSDLEGIRDDVIALFEGEARQLWNKRTNYVEELRPDIGAGAFPFSASRVRTLVLSLGPISSISKVEEKGLFENDSYSTIDPTTYVQFRERGLERLGFYWSPFVRVTYTGGYDETTAPADVQYALLVQSRFRMARTADDAKLITKSQNFEGGGGVYMDADFHPIFASTVARYKRVC